MPSVDEVCTIIEIEFMKSKNDGDYDFKKYKGEILINELIKRHNDV